MITNDEIRSIGKFQRTHALKGELNAVFDDDIDIEAIIGNLPLIIDVDGINVPFFAESIRPKGHFSSLIKLQGVDNCDDARMFVNKEINVKKEDYNDLRFDLDGDEEGGFAEDFIGFDIINSDDTRVGTITDVDTNTDNPLFIVISDKNEQIFIPIVDEFITEIDPDKKALRMDLPDGLIDLNQ